MATVKQFQLKLVQCLNIRSTIFIIFSFSFLLNFSIRKYFPLTLPKISIFEIIFPLFHSRFPYIFVLCFLAYSFIQAIYIAPLQVHYYSEALQTQHGYCAGIPDTARILCQNFTPKCHSACFYVYVCRPFHIVISLY